MVYGLFKSFPDAYGGILKEKYHTDTIWIIYIYKGRLKWEHFAILRNVNNFL